MARGGYRPGSGRPKGSRNRRPTIGAARRLLRDGNLTPLQFMLAVLNDPTAEEARRDKMAIAAAPFCHPRVADARFGKKEGEAERAAEVVKGGRFATPAPPPKLMLFKADDN